MAAGTEKYCLLVILVGICIISLVGCASQFSLIADRPKLVEAFFETSNLDSAITYANAMRDRYHAAIEEVASSHWPGNTRRQYQKNYIQAAQTIQCAIMIAQTLHLMNFQSEAIREKTRELFQFVAKLREVGTDVSKKANRQYYEILQSEADLILDRALNMARATDVVGPMLFETVRRVQDQTVLAIIENDRDIDKHRTALSESLLPMALLVMPQYQSLDFSPGQIVDFPAPLAPTVDTGLIRSVRQIIASLDGLIGDARPVGISQVLNNCGVGAAQSGPDFEVGPISPLIIEVGREPVNIRLQLIGGQPPYRVDWLGRVPEGSTIEVVAATEKKLGAYADIIMLEVSAPGVLRLFASDANANAVELLVFLISTSNEGSLPKPPLANVQAVENLAPRTISLVMEIKNLLGKFGFDRVIEEDRERRLLIRDGRWGPDTVTAYRAFLDFCNLAQLDIPPVDTKHFQELLEVLRTADREGRCSRSTAYERSLSRDFTKSVQEALKVHPDGILGPSTRSRITQLQKEYGLSPNGKIDKIFIDLVLSREARVEGTMNEFERGLSVNDILEIQRSLRLPETGQLDLPTREGIREFQYAFEYPTSTGELTKQLVLEILQRR